MAERWLREGMQRPALASRCFSKQGGQVPEKTSTTVPRHSLSTLECLQCLRRGSHLQGKAPLASNTYLSTSLMP